MTLNRYFKLNALPLWLIIASFGPYVFPAYGLRSEHLLIYPLLLFSVPILLMRQRPFYLYTPILGMLVLLLGITLWTLLVTLMGGYTTELSYNLVSSLENYIQPVAVIILVLCWTNFKSYTELSQLFNRLCRLFILLLCLNSLLAILSIFFDLFFVVRPFVESCFGGASVSQRAWGMARYSGIFNQPIENGMTYSLGLLSWGYLARIQARTGFADYGKLFMLIVGGVLSVSKIFILGGIPLFVLYWNPMANFQKYFNWRVALAAIMGYCAILWMIQFWTGWDYFLRLFKIGGEANLVFLFTGGRFGAESTDVLSRFAQVWQEAPLHGFGFGAISCLDNGYLEFFFQGGMVALFGYFALLAIFFWWGLKSFLRGYKEGRILLALLVLVVGASLGAPVLTLNRFSTIFWVLNTFLFLMLQMKRKGKIAASLGPITY